MKLYVAGPMTGLPDFNYPLFHRTAARLREEGFFVENPAEHCLPPGTDWKGFLAHGISRLVHCDGVATLSGWERSKGARLEVDIAVRLGMPVRVVAEWCQ